MPPEIIPPNNAEIEQALREFEMKSTPVTTPVLVRSTSEDIPKMNRWVMKLSGGMIRQQKQADYVLLVFVGVIILVSFFLFSNGKSAKKIPAYILEQMKEMPVQPH